MDGWGDPIDGMRSINPDRVMKKLETRWGGVKPGEIPQNCFSFVHDNLGYKIFQQSNIKYM